MDDESTPLVHELVCGFMWRFKSRLEKEGMTCSSGLIETLNEQLYWKYWFSGWKTTDGRCINVSFIRDDCLSEIIDARTNDDYFDFLFECRPETVPIVCNGKKVTDVKLPWEEDITASCSSRIDADRVS